MKKEIKSKDLVKLLKEREKAVESGYPLYDRIEKTVEEVIKNNMPKIAADSDMWAYLKPYIDAKDYTATNTILKGIYLKMQKVDYKLTRIKEKIMVKVNKENLELGEFEEISTVKLEGDKAIIETIDKVESYKEMLRDKK